MTGESCPSDLDQLRHDFPGWTFGTTWITVASGPDRRRLTAMKGGLLLSAWSAVELAVAIRRATGPGR